MKKLSQLEAVELITIERREHNRFVTPRTNHLKKRGLIYYDEGWKLTPEGALALRKYGY